MTWGLARRMSTGGGGVAGAGESTGYGGARGESGGVRGESGGVRGESGGVRGESGGVRGESLGFAAKMVGIGLCAGLALVSCQFAIEACFHALR